MTTKQDINRERARDVEALVQQARELGDLIYHCPDCGSEFLLRQVSEKRGIEPDNLGGMRGVLDIGVRCPTCDLFTHSFYTTPRLRSLRQKMDKIQGVYMALSQGQMPLPTAQRGLLMRSKMDEYKRAKRTHQKAFDDTQRVIKKRLDKYAKPEPESETVTGDVTGGPVVD